MISNLDGQERYEKLLELIQLLANATHTQLVFEGVETKTEYEKIRGKYKGLVQGYYFFRPESADVIHSILQDQMS